jgi:uncharacterized protein involved in exopolysaccharide biosynthesis
MRSRAVAQEVNLVDLRDYVRLLRRRWRLIALCTLLVLGAALAATVLQQTVYTAKA